MVITFGLKLDHESPLKKASLAESRVGVPGMLTLLESRLGLAAQGVSQTRRLTGALLALDGLYQRAESYGRVSFERDRFAVAELFLNYRDELMLAGWDGVILLNGSPRLAAISQFANLLDTDLRCGVGDRLLAIHSALKERPLAWSSVNAIGTKQDYSLAWQKVLESLGAVYEEESFASATDSDKTDSDLVRFRKAITSGAATIDLKHDGSLEILSAHSEWTLAQTVQSISAQEKSVLIVGGRNASVLDSAYIRANCPAVGTPKTSKARPVPQTLALALRLLWKPLNPQFLLEFLTHPECPVSSDLRYRLAKALLESPGIGGTQWLEAIAEAKLRINNTAKTPDEAAQRLLRIEEDLSNWVHLKRHDLHEAAPASALKEICERTKAWATKQLSRFAETLNPLAAQFKYLSAAAEQMSQSLDSMDKITFPETHRLLEAVLGNGIDSGMVVPELGHVAYADTPEQVNTSAGVVLWWSAEEITESEPTPWTAIERASLDKSGVLIPSRERAIARTAQSWLKPLHAAREKLLFILPQQRAGDPVVQHPLIGRLRSLLKENDRLPLRRLDQEVSDNKGLDQKTLRELKPILLPKRRRWWKLPETVNLKAREQESFSSLEKFIYTPQLWVLEYAAKIRPGRLNTEQLDCGPRLYGTLIDRLTEELFGDNLPDSIEWKSANSEQLESWVRKRWDKLLEQEGMPLLVMGRQSERARVLSEAVVAVQDLVALFKQMTITVATPHKQPPAVAFSGGKIIGNIDLLLTSANGATGILDLKYGGRSDKERQLKEGRPLQLAIYSYLLSGGKPPFPAGAFYILSSRRLLTCDKGFFVSTNPIAVEDGSSDLQQVWQEFQQVWLWRRGQLDKGLIEVVSDETEKDQDSTPPLANWVTPKDADKYSDHTTLTGF